MLIQSHGCITTDATSPAAATATCCGISLHHRVSPLRTRRCVRLQFAFGLLLGFIALLAVEFKLGHGLLIW